MSHHVLLVATALAMLPFVGIETAEAFIDPLDAPATKTSRAARARLTAATSAGSGHSVVVGQLGRILVSGDGGTQWTQADVPLSADLVAVNFLGGGKTGWACGHYGAVLRSDDGGLHWQRQMDGRAAEKLIKGYYQQKLDAGDRSAEKLLQDAQLNFQDGAVLPFLDVSFESEKSGFVVGAFGMILATEDGGATWVPWMERVDNPDSLHLNAISRIGGRVYIASERGIVFRFDAARQRFQPLQTGYRGTFFGLVGDSKVIIAFGLRGNAYRSTDGGMTWNKVSIPTEVNLIGGTRLDDETFVLADMDGGLWTSANGGESFARHARSKAEMLTGISSAGGRRLLLTGENGVRVEDLK